MINERWHTPILWLARIGIVGLIVFNAVAFASAHAKGNSHGAAGAFGTLIGYAIVAALMIKMPDSAQVQIHVERILQRIHKGTPHGDYVYVIRDIDISGYYKIGRTNHPHARMTAFEVKLPFEIEYVALVQCENAVQLERQLHTHFASKRVRGEWFNLSTEDIEYIQGVGKTTVADVLKAKRGGE